MIHASLFSGIGGPEVAAAMMGWTNAFHCEINPFGRAVLEYWFPESKSYEDITKTDFKEWRGKIDVLTGGFPCQPFSYAGKRGGREDERYLWPQMLRAIDEIRPTWVVGENVVGITTMVEGGVLSDLGCSSTIFQEGDDVHGYELEQSFTIERVCKDLEHIGYSVQPVLIPAAAVGAPHRRDRVFIIAHYENADRERREQQRVCPLHWGRDACAGGNSESEIQRIAKDTIGDGPCLGEHDEQGSKRDERDPGTRNQERICREKRIDTPNADSRRSGEVPSQIYTRLPDGAEPFRNGRERDASNADRTGFQESEQSGRGKDSEEEGAGMDNRTVGSGRDEDIADSFGERLSASVQPGFHGAEEWDGEGRSTVKPSDDAWVKGTWWDNFPTVSPVHSGNDGIPIRMDGISIPFNKWRTESLKAYGNAIVPQVMYRIFQAIEQVGDNQ